MTTQIVPEELLRYETACASLRCRLLCSGPDPEELRDMPHVYRLDLAVICYCLISDAQDGLTIVPVRDYLAACWEKPEEEIFRQAWENTLREECCLEPLESILEGEESAAVPSTGLVLLSNAARTLGAVHMFDPPALRKAAEDLGGAFFILPSSVHECLLLPDDGTYRIRDLNTMVREINQSVLREEEILAAHVFHFDPATEMLRACTDDPLESIAAPLPVLEF